MPFCNCYSDEDQNARLGNEVRNWKILLKAVTQNNKSSRRFPKIQLDRDMWFRLFLRILVFVSCVTIPESDLFFHKTAFYFLLLRTELRISEFMERFNLRFFFVSPIMQRMGIKI